MRRHPQVEHGEVAFECSGLDGSGTQGSYQVLAAMKPLSTSGDFKALKQ
jgi:hypothetical protein